MPKSAEKVLVTGGAGFIGGHLVEALDRAGKAVVVLDNFSWGRIDNISEVIRKNRVSLVSGDVQDSASIASALKGVTKVVHLAALKSVAQSMRNPDLVFEVNGEGTRKALEASLKGEVSRFVYASSCAVYGEAKYLPIDERHPLSPLSPYASSKLLGEQHCLEVSGRGLPTTVLRLFNVYGPRQDSGPYGGVIAKFAQELRNGESPVIYGSGEQVRDFISVHDAVNAILLALDHPNFEPPILNIGSGRPTSINELVKIMRDLFASRVEPVYEKARPGELMRSQADIRRARRILGFQPKVRIEDGIVEYLS